MIAYTTLMQRNYQYLLRNDYYSIRDEQPQFIKGKSEVAPVANVVSVVAVLFASMMLGYYVDWIGSFEIFAIILLMIFLINRLSRRY
jgi:hypothetical protein